MQASKVKLSSTEAGNETNKKTVHAQALTSCLKQDTHLRVEERKRIFRHVLKLMMLLALVAMQEVKSGGPVCCQYPMERSVIS